MCLCVLVACSRMGCCFFFHLAHTSFSRANKLTKSIHRNVVVTNISSCFFFHLCLKRLRDAFAWVRESVYFEPICGTLGTFVIYIHGSFLFSSNREQNWSEINNYNWNQLKGTDIVHCITLFFCALSSLHRCLFVVCKCYVFILFSLKPRTVVCWRCYCRRCWRWWCDGGVHLRSAYALLLFVFLSSSA